MDINSIQDFGEIKRIQVTKEKLLPIGLTLRYRVSLKKWVFGYGSTPSLNQINQFYGIGDTPEEAVEEFRKKYNG